MARGLKSARRKEILEDALKLFRKGGFEGTPMSAVAEAVGMSKAGLYHYFRTKDDLLCELVDPLLECVAELVQKRPKGLVDLSERRKLLEEYLEVILEHMELTALLGDDLSVLSHPQIEPRATELNIHLLGLVAGEGADLREQIRAAGALAVLQAAVVRFCGSDPETVRSAALQAAYAVLDNREK